MLLAPTAWHRLAVAIRRGRRPDLTLAAWEVEPLFGEPRPVSPALVARSPATSPAVAAAPARSLGKREV